MDIVQSMREEYAYSKKWMNQIHLANLALLILTIIVVIFGDHIVWGILALIIPFVVFLFRCIHTHHFGLAEMMRRRILLMDSLGVKLSPGEISQFAAQIGNPGTKTVDFVPPYYNSGFPEGNSRLAENIAESAFFTQHLAKCACFIFLAISVLGVLLFITILTSAFWLAIRDGSTWARPLIAVAVFFSTGDFAWMSLQFHRLHNVAEKVFTTTDKLKTESNIDDILIFRIMDDYNCALIQTPPIPDICFKILSEKLNKAWRTSHPTILI